VHAAYLCRAVEGWQSIDLLLCVHRDTNARRYLERSIALNGVLKTVIIDKPLPVSPRSKRPLLTVNCCQHPTIDLAIKGICVSISAVSGPYRDKAAIRLIRRRAGRLRPVI
jgi:hypothetical protein